MSSGSKKPMDSPPTNSDVFQKIIQKTTRKSSLNKTGDESGKAVTEMTSPSDKKTSIKKTMNQIITPVSEIMSCPSKIAVKVRVINIWRQNEYASNNKSLELILMDEKGDKIQASIRSKFVDKHIANIRDGATYVLSQFSIGENASKYSVMSHKYKINFYLMTSMKVVDTFDGPLNKFNFKRIIDIVDGYDVEKDDTVDIIGCLIHVGDFVRYESNGQPKKRQTFKLLVDRGDDIEGILWDSYAEELDSHTMNAYDEDVRIILLIQFAKISEYKDKNSLSNAFVGTRLFFNADLPEVNSFKDKILSVIDELPTVEKDPPLLSQSALSGPDDFIGKLERITLYEIGDHSKVEWYLCYATINNIVEEDPWYYIACKKCNRKVKKMDIDHPEYGKTTTNLICKGCGPNPKAVYSRFKVHVIVVDDTGSASFTLMDHDVKTFTKKSCGDIRKSMDVNDESIPEEIAKYVGMKLLFKVSVAKFNIDNNYYNYTVQGMTDDSEIIDAFKEKFPPEQDASDNEHNVIHDTQVGDIRTSKDAFSGTGSNVEVLSSTAESPDAKRRCIDRATDPNSVNNTKSVVKKNLIEGNLNKLDIQ